MTYRNSFISGEITPWLDGLTNLEQYSSGCRALENMIVTPYGGAKRRGGTFSRADMAWHQWTTKTKYIEFVYSSTDSTVIRFTVGCENSDNDGRPTIPDQRGLWFLDSDNNWVKIAELGEIPYSIVDIEDLEYKQSADVIFLVHPNYPMYKISRTSLDPTFTFELHPMVGPFKDLNYDSQQTITCYVPEYEGGAEYFAGDNVLVSGGDLQVVSIGTREFYRRSAYKIWTWRHYKRYIEFTSHSLKVGDRVRITSPNHGYRLGYDPISSTFAGTFTVLNIDGNKAWFDLLEWDNDTDGFGAVSYHLVDYSYNDISVNPTGTVGKDPNPSLYTANVNIPSAPPSPDLTQWTKNLTALANGSVTMRANGFSTSPAFIDTDVGKQLLIKANVDYTTSYALTSFPTTGDGSSVYEISQEYACCSDIRISTYRGWLGTVIVERSIDQGGTWEVVDNFYNAEASNYTKSYEFDENLSLIRYKIMDDFRSGGTSADGIRIILSNNAPSVNTVFTITEFIDSNTVVADIYDYAVLNNPSSDWAFGSLGDDNGYVSKIELFEGRMVLSRTKSEYNTIWASRVNNWEDFALDSTPVAPWSYAIPEQDAITYIIEKAGKLFIGTGSGDWILEGSDKELVSGTNVKLRKNSNRGSNGLVAIVDNEILFVGSDGRSLFSYNYDYVKDSYDSEDITMLASHIFEDASIVSMKLQRRPYTILWCVLDNGKVASLTYNKKQGVIAWGRHSFENANDADIPTGSIPPIQVPENGVDEYEYASSARGVDDVIITPSGDEDVIMFSAFSLDYNFITSDENNVEYWSLLEMDEINKEKPRMDFYKETAVPNTAGANFIHALKDRFETADWDLYVAGEYDDNQVFLYGSPFESRVSTTPIPMVTQDGKGHSKYKHVPRIWVKVIDSGEFHCYVNDDDPVTHVVDENYSTGDSVDNTSFIESKIVEAKLKSGWDREAVVTVVSDDIFPLNLIYIETDDNRQP